MLTRIFLIACLLLSSSAFASAEETYYDPAIISPNSLPAPTKRHSPQWEREIAQLMEIQKQAAPNDILEANEEVHPSPDMMFDALSKPFPQAQYPKLHHLLHTSSQTCKGVVDNAKAYWHTDRPYVEDKRIKLQVPPISNGAYPSGHTACSLVLADVLSKIFPNNSDELHRRADKIAYHRLVAGVHYPHDIEGGKKLGHLISAALEKSPAFQTAIAATQQEVR